MVLKYRTFSFILLLCFALQSCFDDECEEAYIDVNMKSLNVISDIQLGKKVIVKCIYGADANCTDAPKYSNTTSSLVEWGYSSTLPNHESDYVIYHSFEGQVPPMIDGQLDEDDMPTLPTLVGYYMCKVTLDHHNTGTDPDPTNNEMTTTFEVF